MDQFGGGTSILLRGCIEGAEAQVQSLGFEAVRVNNDVKVNLAPGQSVRESVRRLEGSGVLYQDFNTIEPTLEEAFLDLVGGKMVDGELRK
jgi:hypothetical protein